MGYEVEQKYRVTDANDLRSRLDGLGACAGTPIEQEDHYYAHPSRDFVATNEALRLRRSGGTQALTYKGPRRPGPIKTREEIETPFAAGPEAWQGFATTLDRLGFVRVTTVAKRREPFTLEFEGRDLEVTLDDLPSLGQFAEVEALARDADDATAAEGAVARLAAVLGLTEVEPRSYLRMTLEGR